MIRILLLTSLSLLFSSCLSITQEVSSYDTYSLMLNNKTLFKNKIKESIEIIEPKSLGSLNSLNIVYKNENLSQENYALSKWSDKPSKMLQSMIIENLSNEYYLVKSSYIKAQTTYRLQGLILDFKQFYINNKSYVSIKINNYLENKANKKTVFKQFSYKKETQGENANSTVVDLNLLSNLYVKDLNLWIKEELNNN